MQHVRVCGLSLRRNPADPSRRHTLPASAHPRILARLHERRAQPSATRQGWAPPAAVPASAAALAALALQQQQEHAHGKPPLAEGWPDAATAAQQRLRQQWGAAPAPGQLMEPPSDDKELPRLQAVPALLRRMGGH